MAKSEEMRSGPERVAFAGIDCEITTPFHMPAEAPTDCIAVGWHSTIGTEPRFAISVLAEGGFAMVGHLDWPSYKKLASLILRIGEEAIRSCSTIDENSLSATSVNLQRFVDELHTVGSGDDAECEPPLKSFQMTIQAPH